jgi:hypothetical protein
MEYTSEYFGVDDALEHCPKQKSYWTRIQSNPHVAKALADS